MLVDLIQKEIDENCWRRPAKRHALELALLMMEQRHDPFSLMTATEHFNKLGRRMRSVKV